MCSLQLSNLESWYVVHCQPLKERQADAALAHYLGLITYLPAIRRRFRGRVQQAPLFPRYLFVRANLQVVALSTINATPGVLRMVAFDARPQPVSAALIEALRQRVDLLNAQGGLPEHNFHPGEAVQLKDGPLQGLEAVFVGPMKPSERVQILIHFLGQLREVDVDVDMLERPSSMPTLKRERRTRGKGRRVKRQ